MVRRSPKSSKTLILIFTAGLAALAVVSVFSFILPRDKVGDQPEVDVDPKAPMEVTPEPEEDPKPEFIDLQPTVDQWAASIGSNAGVYIYDLDNDKVAASYNHESIFFTASVYKLFFVYEAYLRINQGLDDPNEYFADGKTRIECLDLIIRESYNPCADPLRNELMGEIGDIIANKFKIENTSNGALNASAKAVADMLKIYYKHEDLSEELWGKIADSMLNQPTTTYNWRQGLPSGFSEAKVYNKVGWSYNTEENHWSTYNDAAIVEFTNLKRHYIIVVLTRNTSHKKLIKLGQLIEQKVLEIN